MSDLLQTLNNPAVQQGLGLLTVTRPELGLAIQLVTALLNGWKQQSEINVAIKALDMRAAQHIKALVDPNNKMHALERTELEIRLHELLTVLIKLGGL